MLCLLRQANSSHACRDVKVYTPFPVDSIDHTITRTYLDSTGRHTVVIKKHGAVENHAQDIFVRRICPSQPPFPLTPLTVQRLSLYIGHIHIPHRCSAPETTDRR